ncbi:hypothetical protein AD998_08165 [bacterium 336/3]|nr:hypothetical protein AD998_08165 [bacterium 336/3]
METEQKQLTYQDYKDVVEQLFSDNKNKLEKEFTLKTFIISNYQSNTDLFKELDKFYKQAINDFDTIRLIKHDSKNDKIVFPTKEEKNSRIALNKLAYEIHDSVLLDCTKQIAWRASFDNGEYWKNLKDYQTYFFGSDNLDLGKELLRYKKADFYYIQYDNGNLHEQNSQIIDFIQKQIDLKIGEKKPLTIKDVIEKLFDREIDNLEKKILLRDYIKNNIENNPHLIQDLENYKETFIRKYTAISIGKKEKGEKDVLSKTYDVQNVHKVFNEALKEIRYESSLKLRFDDKDYFYSLEPYLIYFNSLKININNELLRYRKAQTHFRSFGGEFEYNGISEIIDFLNKQLEKRKELKAFQDTLPSKENFIDYFEQIDINDNFIVSSHITTHENQKQNYAQKSIAGLFWQKLHDLKVRTNYTQTIDAKINTLENLLEDVNDWLKKNPIPKKELLSQISHEATFLYSQFLEVYLNHLKGSTPKKTKKKNTTTTTPFDSLVNLIDKYPKLLDLIKNEKGLNIAIFMFTLHELKQIEFSPTTFQTETVNFLFEKTGIDKGKPQGLQKYADKTFSDKKTTDKKHYDTYLTFRDAIKEIVGC